MQLGQLLLRALVVASALSPAALAHEDDPKILDRRPPYAGPGFRRANLSQPDQLALSGGGFVANGLTLMSWVPLSEMGSPQSGSDCWGYTSASGREYVLMGHWAGTTVVDISSMGAAVVLTTLPGPPSLWRDIKVYGDHAYVVSEGGGGIQVFSMAQVDSGIVTQVGTVTTGGTSKSHNVAINEDSGYLYRLGGDDNGLRAYDLNADPIDPPLVGSWNTRYIHDAQIVSYTSGPYAGKEIAFACSGFNGGWVGTGLDVLDVTDKSNITVLANVFYGNAQYSHQGWLSPDRQYFYLGDEVDEDGSFPTTTHVIDVSNLSNPQAVTSFTNGSQSVGHNLYTKGDLIYEANYRSGLRIFDASNPLAPVETAFFDTYPEDDLDGYNGLWNVYPYFESGVLVGSDLERGLFVWWPGTPALVFDLPNGAPSFVDPGGVSLPVTIQEAQSGDLVVGSARLHVHDGQSWSSSPLASLGGGNFLANFPATPCGSELRYYFSADSASGDTWSFPGGAPFEICEAVSGVSELVLASDDLELASGWTAGLATDDATTGIWTRVDPNGTQAQPSSDHTQGGSQCYVTGQGSSGGSLGEEDVDDGVTTLLTPAYDLSAGASPRLSYWRWYSNNQGSSVDDVFIVDISSNGTDWVTVETLGPGDPQASGGWYQHTLMVSDFVAPSATVQLRFRASDLGSGSIVEAAIDDVQVTDFDCGNGCGATSYCTAAPNSAGAGAVMSSSGSASLAANDLVLNVSGATASQPGLFYYGSNQISSPFGDGIRCVGGGTYRFNPVQFTGASGSTSRAIDYGAAPTSSGPGAIQAGDTWNFQYWYRDPAAGGTGFNLSDGLSIVFCP